jgi:hypothetical protein
LPGTATCFKLVTTPATFATAKTACAAQSGWALASVVATNIDVVNDIVRCTDALVGSTYTAASATCPDLHDDGSFTNDCAGSHPYLCQGPLPPATPPPAGTATPLTEVSGADANGDGVPDACTGNNQWYFDNDASPTHAFLCPQTCTRVTQDKSAQVSVQIACKPPSAVTPTGGSAGDKVPIDTTRQITYVSGCSTDERTQWDFMAYHTTTPGTSKVTFSARTADSEADITAAMFHPLATADTVDGTADCLIAPPAPNCPVSVFDQLGSPDQFGPVLQLNIEMTPGSHGEAPTADDWNLTFSCVPGQ